MAATALQYLDSESQNWTVTRWDNALTIPASVPGDLITDLAAAGVIGDPIFELTFLDGIWDDGNWTYTTHFTVDPVIAASIAAKTSASTSLVFESLKLVADVSLNGHYLGFAADQFLRYSFPVQQYLDPTGVNTLAVTIQPGADKRLDEGRVTGAGGGWDWGPIRSFVPADGPPRAGGAGVADDTSMSRGIVRSLYLLQSDIGSLVINQTVPRVFYKGAYPTQPLTDATAGPFEVVVDVHVSNPNPSALSNVDITVAGIWGGGNTTHVTIPPGDSVVTVSITVPVGAVELWWTADTTPASKLGAPQPMYDLNVLIETPGTVGSQAGQVIVDPTQRIGFRVFTLVTADDSVPSAIDGIDGSGNLTMRFKLNGANIFSRGADVIPIEWLEGRQSSEAYHRMLRSAVDAGFNTIRIDGIDAYFPDAFYNTCDNLGLLLYHDIQYSQAQPVPTATAMQDAELRYQIRRLSEHPSIAVYDACNECGGHGIYASFVSTVVAVEDPSRPVWPSSPSVGWTSGVDMLWSLPNGSPLGLQPRLQQKHDEAVHATAAVTGSPIVPCGVAGAAGDCTAQFNVDYCVTCYDVPHPNVNSSQACCDACTAAGPDACWTAVFYEGVCWFKPKVNVTAPIYSAGRVAVWPAGNGPIPPMPTPGPEPPSTRETHGPYQHGGGFPAVDDVPDSVDVNLPPALFPSYTIGPNISGTYASEFGCVAFSSFESMSATLAPEHWSVHGGTAPDTCVPDAFFQRCSGDNAMAQRNYPMDTIVAAYFGSGMYSADAVGEDAFARQLWISMISQALSLASNIETRRSHNTWGTLIWQLNEIWPTGGWGTIEYGVGPGFTGGQIVGGRWKPIQHWLQRHLYTDLTMACGNDGRCYVKNDDAISTAGYPLLSVNRTLLRVSDGAVVGSWSTQLALPIGGGSIAWLCADSTQNTMACNTTAQVLTNSGCAPDGSDCILLTAVVNQQGASGALTASAHSQLLAAPGLIANTSASNFRGNLTVTAGSAPEPDGSIPLYLSFSGSNSTGDVALLVTLTTAVAGRFSDNAFTLVQSQNAAAGLCADATGLCPLRVATPNNSSSGAPTLFFIPWTDESFDTLVPALLQSTRIQHLGMYA